MFFYLLYHIIFEKSIYYHYILYNNILKAPNILYARKKVFSFFSNYGIINKRGIRRLKVKFDEMPDFLRDFIFHLESVRNLSKNTVEGYLTDLELFLKFIKKLKRNIEDKEIEELSIIDIDIKMINSITVDDIYLFIHYLMNTRGNTSKTIARKIASLKTFFKYEYTIKEIIESNPTDKLSSPSLEQKMPKYLKLNECEQLLSSIDGPFKERDYCMIVIFLNCGIRLSELVGIDLSDIREDQILIRGKGNKERLIYFNEACQNAVKDYQNFKLTFYKDKNYDHRALFLNRNGKRLQKRWIEELVKKYMEKAGLEGKGYTPHKLRHTSATMMYQNGSDVRILKDILGHANLGTTQIYTHTSDSQMKDAMFNNPISELSSKKTVKKDNE